MRTQIEAIPVLVVADLLEEAVTNDRVPEPFSTLLADITVPHLEACIDHLEALIGGYALELMAQSRKQE